MSSANGVGSEAIDTAAIGTFVWWSADDRHRLTLGRGAGFCAAVGRRRSSQSGNTRRQRSTATRAPPRHMPPPGGRRRPESSEHGNHRMQFVIDRLSRAEVARDQLPHQRPKTTRRGFGAPRAVFSSSPNASPTSRQPAAADRSDSGARRSENAALPVGEAVRLEPPSPSRRGSAPTRAAPRRARTRTDRSDRSSRPRPRRAGRGVTVRARGAVRR